MAGRHFIIEYSDNGDLATRDQHRAAHVGYRIALGEALMLAGPLLDDAGKAIGSLIVLKAESPEAASEVATQDPLVLAGLLSLVSIRPYRVAAILGRQP